MGPDKRAGEDVCRERKGHKPNWFDFKVLLNEVTIGARIKVGSGGLLCVCVYTYVRSCRSCLKIGLSL